MASVTKIITYDSSNESAILALTTANHNTGLVDVAGEYHQTGVVGDGGVSTWSLFGNPYGILDSGDNVQGGGILSPNGGFQATGIIDMDGSVWSYGILDSGGNYSPSGIIDSGGNGNPSGILDAGGTYQFSGIFDINSSFYSVGIIDGNGFGYNPAGTLDNSGVYRAAGTITDGTWSAASASGDDMALVTIAPSTISISSSTAAASTTLLSVTKTKTAGALSLQLTNNTPSVPMPPLRLFESLDGSHYGDSGAIAAGATLPGGQVLVTVPLQATLPYAEIVANTNPGDPPRSITVQGAY